MAHISNTIFLGIVIKNSLSWKLHTEQIIPKLSASYYSIRCIKPNISYETLKMGYYSYFPSSMTYGLIFWRNSSYRVKIFRIQKNTIRIIMGHRSRKSCKDLFKKLKMIPLQSQYILSLLLFAVNDKEQYKLHSEIQSIKTRQISNLHQTLSNLAPYQKSIYIIMLYCLFLCSVPFVVSVASCMCVCVCVCVCACCLILILTCLIFRCLLTDTGSVKCKRA